MNCGRRYSCSGKANFYLLFRSLNRIFAGVMKREDDIRQAVEVLRRGGVILYPTDTVWGIGCDATNAEAVKRVYDIKQRDDSKALICLVDSDARLQRYVRNVPDVAWQLLDAVVKPTTVILDNAVNLAPNLIAEDGSIGIRITKEPFSQELCFRFQKALVSTSANISGEPAPQNFSDISEEILNAVDYICFSAARNISRIHRRASSNLLPTAKSPSSGSNPRHRNLELLILELRIQRIQRKGHLGTWDYGTWNYEFNE